MTNVKWILPQTPVDDADIRRFESSTKVYLPEDYKKWVVLHNGSSPEPTGIILADGFKFTINSFLSLSTEDDPNALLVLNWYIDRLPEGVIPIADDPGGNYVCFHYLIGITAPTIVFWDHEEADPVAQIKPICSSFDELLLILTDLG